MHRLGLAPLLAGAFGALTFLSILIVTLLVLRSSETRVVAGIGQGLQDLAIQMGDKLDRGMLERVHDIRTIAALDPLPDPNASPADLRRVLDRMRATFEPYAWIGIATPDGKVKAAAGGLLENADVSKRPWFQAALHKPFVGDVHDALLLAKLLPARSDGEPLRFVDVATPLVASDGTQIGVLGAHLAWSWAEEVERSLLQAVPERTRGAEMLILDRDGTVLLGPGKGSKLALASVQAAQRGERGYAIEQFGDGARYLVGYARETGYLDYAGLGWLILARQPIDFAMQPVHDLTRDIVLWGTVCGAVAMLLALLLARRLARPLEQLTGAALAIDAERDPNFPYVAGYREVGRLARALRGMTQGLWEAKTTLEKRVTDRTQALVQAVESAESATRAKSDMLAVISHEIRTPMNGILGYSALLAQSGLDEDQARYAASVHRSAESLLVLLNDLLDASKLEAGKLAIETLPFDLQVIVDDAVAIVEPRAVEKHLALTATLPPDAAGWVEGDPTRVRQILINLLGNAVKFTERGSVTLTVRRDGDRVRFEVQDTGPGMEPTVRARLFQRFAQADGTIARRFGGTGLGLAICRELTELMHGTIGVDSEPGKGSRFWFELRLPQVAAPSRATAPVARFDGTGKRVLLAEDNPVNQQLAGIILKRAGFLFDVVGNGEEAVEAATTQRYDLILMDVQMPHMDGLEATRALRQAGIRTPIVALTAHALGNIEQRYRAAGMDTYLAKPFTPNEVIACIARVLGVQSDGQADGAAETAALVNPKQLEALRAAVGDDTIRDLIQVWVEHAEERRGRLATLLAERDLLGVRDEAHSAISSAGSYGAVRLEHLARRLEQAAIAKDERAVQTIGETMLAAYTPSIDAMRTQFLT